MASVGPLRRYAPLILIAALGLALVGLGSRGALAIFSDQATSGDNTFTTIPVFPVDTGWLDPSAEAADSGGDDDGFELDPTNAFADDGGYASNIDDAGDRHRFYDYGISLTAGSTIFGIEVRVDWWLDDTTDENSLGVELSWDGGTSWTAMKTDTEETTSEHTVVLGARNDTWSRTWSVSEFSDVNFRVRVTCNSTGAGRNFYLDWIPVKIHYIPP
ncbi:MAG: hypothetical protein WBF66_12620 [Dehalococcoidia bacterium]